MTAFTRARPEGASGREEGGGGHCAVALIAATTIAPSIVRVGQSTPETMILNVLEIATTRTIVLNGLTVRTGCQSVRTGRYTRSRPIFVRHSTVCSCSGMNFGQTSELFCRVCRGVRVEEGNAESFRCSDIPFVGRWIDGRPQTEERRQRGSFPSLLLLLPRPSRFPSSQFPSSSATNHNSPARKCSFVQWLSRGPAVLHNTLAVCNSISQQSSMPLWMRKSTSGRSQLFRFPQRHLRTLYKIGKIGQLQ